MSNMNLLNPDCFLFFSITVLHFLFAPVSCFHHNHHQQQKWLNSPSQPPTQGFVMEDKSRLGSTPPSCYNRCDHCNPCMAVQVPTPIRDRFRPGLHKLVPLMKKKKNEEKSTESVYSKSSTGNDQYTNYKPLGWKCRCGNHIFNP
ncbi:hypothetical protein MKW98_001618 [Papaver atlanticum]|uniref:Epidermal patterning factor-like protein n=1 Tax=Papaver atlanticum TaxID=357466 RepID=A0AAD4S7X7_9MAGN|nr:hypothetical protein MKW98_001618 [Papaver atlanticum]